MKEVFPTEYWPVVVCFERREYMSSFLLSSLALGPRA